MAIVEMAATGIMAQLAVTVLEIAMVITMVTAWVIMALTTAAVSIIATAVAHTITIILMGLTGLEMVTGQIQPVHRAAPLHPVSKTVRGASIIAGTLADHPGDSLNTVLHARITTGVLAGHKR